MNILEENHRSGLDIAHSGRDDAGDGGFGLRELQAGTAKPTCRLPAVLTARAEDANQVRGSLEGARTVITQRFRRSTLAALPMRALRQTRRRVSCTAQNSWQTVVNKLRREGHMVENKPIDLTPKI